MGLLEVFGKKDVGKSLVRGLPYSLKLRFRPFRMSVKSKSPVDLVIDLTSLREEEPLMTSVVVQVPKVFGLDAMGISTMREIRLGYMKPGETKSLNVEIHA